MRTDFHYEARGSYRRIRNRVLLALLTVLVTQSAPAVTSQQQPPPPQGAQVRLNRVIELFEQNKPAFGIFSQNHSLRSAMTLARSELDFLLIDMEHTPLDFERLQTFLIGMTDKQAIMRKGNLQPSVMPFVRIPQNGQEGLQFIVKQVLDVGVFGIMFPNVTTAAQARASVQAARYPQRRGVPDFAPEGLRGNSPANAVWFWGIRDYADRADTWPLDARGEVLVSVQIESVEGLKNVESIVEVPGIGAVFVGPNDLSHSMGFGGASDSPELEAAIQTVVKAAARKKIPIGITAYTPELVTKRLAEGFKFLAIGQDIGLTPGIDATLKAGRAAGGKASSPR
jgi:4-hydroxy-2-oxoheptanedioate aldolase